MIITDKKEKLISNENELPEYSGCKYCGTMDFELISEGSPCGINHCDVYTCCQKAWRDHVKAEHPSYWKKEFTLKRRIRDWYNRFRFHH